MTEKPRDPKPQQQTLSVRISDALRARLERARKLTAAKTGDYVSTSEIAKQLLESAREDRLDLVDMLADPTTALLQIRRKGESQHPLSQPEWTVLAHFVQQGVEFYSTKTPNAVSRDSWLAILDAFLAVYELRGERIEPEDAYYLTNLPQACRPAVKRGEKAQAVTPDVVRRTVSETRRRVLDPGRTIGIPLFIGRNLYHLLEDTTLGGADAVNRALRPFWPVLWRLAARGHYAITQVPLREPSIRPEGLYRPPIPSITEGAYTLSFAGATGQDLSVLLSLPGAFGPLYPISGFPKIAEFRAMLTALASGSESRSWTGLYFFGYARPQQPEPATEVWFRAHDNGITFGFPLQDWITVEALFRRAWKLPDVRLMWEALTLEYGEL